MEQGPLNLGYRDWFFISLLVLVNVIAGVVFAVRRRRR